MDDDSFLLNGLRVAHRRFIENMFSEFGIIAQPPEIEIHYGKFGTSGTDGKTFININHSENPRELSDDMDHETSHYLHASRNPDVWKKVEFHHRLKRSSLNINHPLIRLVEFVAYTGMIRYNLIRPLADRPRFVYDFIGRMLERAHATDTLSLVLPAYFVARTNPQLFKEIISSPLENAISMVDMAIKNMSPSPFLKSTPYMR